MRTLCGIGFIDTVPERVDLSVNALRQLAGWTVVDLTRYPETKTEHFEAVPEGLLSGRPLAIVVRAEKMAAEVTTLVRGAMESLPDWTWGQFTFRPKDNQKILLVVWGA